MPSSFDFGPARLESGVVDEIEGAVHVLLELTRVVDKDQPGLERHGVGGNHVAPAQLDPVDAHLPRGPVDGKLDRHGGLGAPGAPIGADRRAVGENAARAGVDGRRPVDAGDAAQIAERRERPEDREIGAEARHVGHPKREERAIAVEGKLDFIVAVAAVVVAQESPRSAHRSI